METVDVVVLCLEGPILKVDVDVDTNDLVTQVDQACCTNDLILQVDPTCDTDGLIWKVEVSTCTKPRPTTTQEENSVKLDPMTQPTRGLKRKGYQLCRQNMS